VKGVIFNLLEEIIRREHGEAAWDDLLEAAGLDGAYTSLGSYPDAHLGALVGAASVKLGYPPDEVIRWFGRQALPLLARRYARFFDGHRSTLPFLLTLNDVIHTEVRKIYPGAEVPVFTFDVSTADRLVMGYRSSRRLCALAHGFIEAAAAHYGEAVVIEQTECMHRGDDRCVFAITVHKSG